MKNTKNTKNTKTKWSVVNVVWYDGCEAFVSKFIVQTDVEDGERGVTEDSKQRVREYLSDGEVLKFDLLYEVDFDNILAMREASDQPMLQEAFERFKIMWF